VILVDTSVWIEAFRRAASAEAQHLRELLDADQVVLAGPVRIEILSGSSTAELPRLRRVLSALPLHLPTARTWDLIESWVDRAVRAGQRFGMADLLIAGIAAENGFELWSLDGDFARMASLGFLRAHGPDSGRR
jgi:predicted nucleic acid-binding protein